MSNSAPVSALDALMRDADAVNARLKDFPELKVSRVTPDERVLEAESYALTNGGKRIRAALVIEFYRLFSEYASDAIPPSVLDAACAVEMTHAFSLIHDDMPEMDDDDIRRGRPSTHIAYGAATGLLAGDALAILPFEVLSRLWLSGELLPETALELINTLARCCGAKGMIAGQMLDLWSEENPSKIDESFLRRMSDLKTGEMLRAACVMGAILAEAGEKEKKSAEIYAKNVGLAFQITDDVLDVTSTDKALGKPVGSDKQRGKPTFADLLGIDGAMLEARRLSAAAADEVKKYPGGELLRELAIVLCDRKY